MLELAECQMFCILQTRQGIIKFLCVVHFVASLQEIPEIHEDLRKLLENLPSGADMPARTEPAFAAVDHWQQAHDQVNGGLCARLLDLESTRQRLEELVSHITMFRFTTAIRVNTIVFAWN